MSEDSPYVGKKYRVTIVRTSDGEQREYAHEPEGDVWDDGTMYMWTDGNYGCDCNRHLFFHRSKGGEPDEDQPCGETAYRIPHATLEDGTKVVIDDPHG